MIFVFIFIVIITFIIYYYFSTKEKFLILIGKIEMSEEEVMNMLNTKRNLLIPICKNVNCVLKKKIFTNLKNLENIEDFNKLDRELTTTNYDLKEYLLINKEFVFSDESEEKYKELEELEVKLRSAKDYYNKYVSIYNEMIDKFPSSVIAKRQNIDFKFVYSLEKIEMFDILNKKTL